jgi:hypothetical protein
MWFLLSALEAIALMMLTYSVVPGAAVFMAAWCALAFVMWIASRRGVFPHLTTIQRRVNSIGVMAFPAIICGWMVADMKGLFPHTGLPNRIQHLLWSASMVSLLVPLFARWWGSVARAERVLMAIGVVMLLGSFIEVFEYNHFSQAWSDQPWKGMWAWRDTTFDVSMNMIGSFCTALVVSGRPRSSSDTLAL